MPRPRRLSRSCTRAVITVEVVQHTRAGKTRMTAPTRYCAVLVVIAGVALEAEAVSRDAAEIAANKIRKELKIK